MTRVIVLYLIGATSLSTVLVHREGETYIAHCAASGTGDTPEAALAALNASFNDDRETDHG